MVADKRLLRQNEIIQKIRDEPYNFWTNNCIHKAFKAKSQLGFGRVVICLGLARTRYFGRRLVILVIHAWFDNGRRIEVSRPPEQEGIWGIINQKIRPLLGIWI